MVNFRKWAVLGMILSLVIVSGAYVLAGELPAQFHGVGVLKSAEDVVYVGDVVTYQIRVYNPSDFTLHNITVVDSMLNFSVTIPVMSVGNTTGVTYVLHKETLANDTNPLVNTVEVDAVDSEGAQVSASAQAITTLVEKGIDITKIGPEVACEGENIVYTITVNNTANTTLEDVMVEDALLGFSWQGALNSGETNVFNLTYTVPYDTAGNLTNTAVAWAEWNETVIYAETSWTTEILRAYTPYSKGYWKTHPDNWSATNLTVGNMSYTKAEALEILMGANAKDATRMLAAQLIAAKLNRLVDASRNQSHCNTSESIDEIIEEADAFLTGYPIGSDPQGAARQEALFLKDSLDAYNNGN